MPKNYSKNEDLFLLNEILNHNTLKEAFSKIAPVLNRSETGVEQRYYNLKKIYPNHPAYKTNWRIKDRPVIKIRLTDKIKVLFNNLFRK